VSDYFNTVLYTGNGSTQSITGVGFQPDWTWIKNRAAADAHVLTDAVRGATEELQSNAASAETTNADGLTAFDTDGFSLGDDVLYNTSSEAYVAWNWLASNTTVSNAVGDIPSTVSVNTTSGFSIVSYTGNGTSDSTVGHGLGVAPSMIIVKNRDAANYWIVQHTSLPSYTYNLYLQTTDPQQNDSQFTAANTSTVFQLDAGKSVNITSNKFIAYCFAEVPGYSAFGSYTGNGDNDGPFVYTGFRPAFVIIKTYTNNGANTGYTGWTMYDNKRPTGSATTDSYNTLYSPLYANNSYTEGARGNGDAGGTVLHFDLLSNGFKIRNGGTEINSATIESYIYMAFAENPFKNSNARVNNVLLRK
jgi:hypothetical protein